MRIAGYLCIILSLASCSKTKESEKVLGQAKMQDVMWDMIRADVLTSEFPRKDSTDPKIKNITLQKKIFHAHGITREEFYNSFDFYTKKPEVLTVMLDTVAARQSRSRVQVPIKGIKGYE